MKCWLFAGFLVALMRIGEGGYFTLPLSLRPSQIHAKICEPGTKWQSRCNPCVCSPDGRPLCEQQDCPGQDDEKELFCSPGSRWMSACNSCWCTAEGRAMCTRMGCEEGVAAAEFGASDAEETEIKTPKVSIEFQENYKNRLEIDKFGEFIRSVENVLEDGAYFIMRREDQGNRLEVDSYDAPEEQYNKFEKKSHVIVKREETKSRREDKKSITKRAVCKPFEEFQSDCNSCECSANGHSYTCTQNECMEGRDVDKDVEIFMESEGVDHIERHSVCKPRGTFYIGCNTCHCNYDGTDYSCTNKPCPLPDDVELFHELKVPKSSNKTSVCVPNHMFIKDCNTCWCNEDGTSFFCTRKVCIPELPEDVSSDDEKIEELRVIQKECRPDEVFEMDCNMCRCNPDGKSFSCTRRACIEQPEDDSKSENTASRKTRGAQLNNKELPKTCQPGQEFRMDCNKCLCDNEGQDFSCTRIDCNALNNNNNGGSRRKRETILEEKEEISAECTPGSVFDRECNVCRCLSDGLSAECTTNTCSKPDQANKLDNTLNPQASETDLGFRCNPGEQFKRSCNDCSCSADGRSIFCSVRLCDKDFIPRD